MRRIVLFIGCLIIFSCKKNDEKVGKIIGNKKNENSKSIVLDKNSVVFISPSSDKLEKMKKSMGDVFFISADDANYYYSNAIHFLDSLNIKYSNEDETKIFLYKDKNRNTVRIKNNDKNNNWYALLYNNDKKKYKIIYLLTFPEEYSKFFTIEHDDYTTIEASNIEKQGKYSIIKEIKCDLNQDKIEDKILVYKNNKEFDSDDDSSKQSPIVVFLGVGNNKYKKFENPNVFSNDSNDFFKNLVIKDNFFTVELDNEIPNEYTINKYITFKYDKSSKKIVLFKYGQNLLGDKNGTLLYTSKNFGKIDFELYDSNTILNKVSKN